MMMRAVEARFQIYDQYRTQDDVITPESANVFKTNLFTKILPMDETVYRNAFPQLALKRTTEALPFAKYKQELLGLYGALTADIETGGYLTALKAQLQNLMVEIVAVNLHLVSNMVVGGDTHIGLIKMEDALNISAKMDIFSPLLYTLKRFEKSTMDYHVI